MPQSRLACIVHYSNSQHDGGWQQLDSGGAYLLVWLGGPIAAGPGGAGRVAGPLRP